MAKDLYFSRYLKLYEIINNNQFINIDDLIKRYNNSDYSRENAKSISKRTFHRDLAEMKSLFGIDIKFDKAHNGYVIAEDKIEANAMLLIDSYRYIHTFQRFKHINKLIASEAKITGKEHLETILFAIDKRIRIQFNYQKFVNSECENRTIEPYFIKEFKSRWYVIGLDLKDKKQKSFAMERISNLVNKHDGLACYDIPKNLTPDSFFKDVFGIFKLPHAVNEDIMLSFKPLKGKFIKSNPLHNSQETIIDNNDEFRIKLNMQITHDFVMEILSHGDEVKVIFPEILINEICSKMENALKQYK